MRRDWEPEDLVGSWTLVEDDWRLLGNKSGATRLAFALLLKFFELEGRFPQHPRDMPTQAITYLGEQVHVDGSVLTAFDWDGRSVERHRAQIRAAMGFRECSVDDADGLTNWLATEVCGVELSRERQRDAFVARCRADRVEPPAPAPIDRIVTAARAAADQAFCTQTVERLPDVAIRQLEDLVGSDVGEDSPGGSTGLLADLKADPGRLGLETLLPRSRSWSEFAVSSCHRPCSRRSARSSSLHGEREPRRSMHRTFEP